MADKKKTTVTLPRLKIGRMTVRIRGTSPLVLKHFHEKSIEMIEGAQTGAAKKRELKNVADEFNKARYVFKGKDCFLAVHIKKAMMTAAADADMWKSEVARQLFVRGELNGGEYVEIKGAKPSMRRDWVRNRGRNGAVADIRHRPEYVDWFADITIEFNESVITPQQIFNLLDIAGFSCGIGENRPSKSGGDWGRFEIDPKSIDKPKTKTKTDDEEKDDDKAAEKDDDKAAE